LIQHTVKPPHKGHPGTDESGRCREVAVMGRQECNMTLEFFQGWNIFILKKMLIVASKYVTQSKDINKTETTERQRPTTCGMDKVCDL